MQVGSVPSSLTGRGVNPRFRGLTDRLMRVMWLLRVRGVGCACYIGGYCESGTKSCWNDQLHTRMMDLSLKNLVFVATKLQRSSARKDRS